MKILPILGFLLFAPLLNAQTDFDMDELARNTPARTAASVDRLAEHLYKNTPDQRGCVRAIFAWVTLHIRYLDTSNKSEIWATPDHLERQRPDRVLRNRTAVCQGFANLFQALADACGIDCQVVTGIVKDEDGQVPQIGHAWIAAKVLDRWYLFDPTWSVPTRDQLWTVNDKYFMASPEKFVLNHLPDDPAWQLLENPITEEQFRRDDYATILRYVRERREPVFHFHDTLQQWLALDSVQRMFQSESRILAFNGGNERVIFALGQNYWGLFFDLRARLDSLADHSILDEKIPLDTAPFFENIHLMARYHQRARDLFDQLTEPDRRAMANKFFDSQDVEAILIKLRGDAWAAMFEHNHHLSRDNVDESSLSNLQAISNVMHDYYHAVARIINCQKLNNTCYELWHNLSLVDLQLAERYALFAQNLLAEKSAGKFQSTAESAMKSARITYDLAADEIKKLLTIPPVYDFIRDRQQRVFQGDYSLKALEIRRRRLIYASQVSNALNPDSNQSNAKSVASKMNPILEDLADLCNEIEDNSSSLGQDYVRLTLFNLHQEGYAMRFNQASLYYRSGLDQYQKALENNTLASEKKRITTEVQKAFPWIKEAAQSLDYLKRSKRLNNSAIEQRQGQINKLNQSIKEFLDTLE